MLNGGLSVNKTDLRCTPEAETLCTLLLLLLLLLMLRR